MTRETRETREARFAALAARAEAAGLAAGEAAIPAPIEVYEAEGLSNRRAEGGRSWYVSEGVCGFAWIKVRPATSSFARWARASNLALREWDGSTYPAWGTAYGGGLSRSVYEFGQSLTRKEAFARAYAATLREAGINATTGSRLD